MLSADFAGMENRAAARFGGRFDSAAVLRSAIVAIVIGRGATSSVRKSK
jgi:hypothetical protein